MHNKTAAEKQALRDRLRRDANNAQATKQAYTMIMRAQRAGEARRRARIEGAR